MFNFMKKILKKNRFKKKNKGNTANNAHDIQDLMICGMVRRKEIVISQYPTLTVHTISHIS